MRQTYLKPWAFFFRDAHIVTASVFLSLLAGCATLPDVRPFADATISLRSAVAASGTEVVDELSNVEIEGARAEAKKLEAAWREHNKLLAALVEYANSLQAIVDSGNNGAESVKTIAASVSKLAQVANIAQPGSGAAGALVTETASFVYGQIAKARAASSLEKALAEVQPAIERIAEVMSDDMGSMNDLVRVAAQAQRDALQFSEAAPLGYRKQLQKRRNALQDQVSAALREGKKPSEIAEASELERVNQLLAAAEPWNDSFQKQIDVIALRERLTHQLISETRSAFGDWAAVHSRLLAAVRTKRIPSATEIVEAAERIRDLVNKFKAL
jgi:hypothetical protein